MTRKNHGFESDGDRLPCKVVESRHNDVVSYIFVSKSGLRLGTRRGADVLLIITHQPVVSRRCCCQEMRPLHDATTVILNLNFLARPRCLVFSRRR